MPDRLASALDLCGAVPRSVLTERPFREQIQRLEGRPEQSCDEHHWGALSRQRGSRCGVVRRDPPSPDVTFYRRFVSGSVWLTNRLTLESHGCRECGRLWRADPPRFGVAPPTHDRAQALCAQTNRNPRSWVQGLTRHPMSKDGRQVRVDARVAVARPALTSANVGERLGDLRRPPAPEDRALATRRPRALALLRLSE